MRKKASLRQSIQLVAVSLAAFVVTTAGVRYWAGSSANRRDDSLAMKLDYFVAHKDDYTSVFIGNSRIYRGLDPVAFDQAMAEFGEDTVSFNLGVPSMTAAEIDKAVRQIVASDPCCLDYVFIDLWSPATIVSVRADRTVASYDPVTAGLALKHVLSTGNPWPEKLYKSAEIIAAAGFNVVNVGSLVHTLPWSSDSTAAGETLDRSEGYDYDGYKGFEDESAAEYNRRREVFITSGADGFEEKVTAQKAAYENRPDLENYKKDLIFQLAERVDELGDTNLFFIVTPFGESYQSPSLDTVVLDYNNVSAYPELYEMSLWFDRGHFNSIGAEKFSREVANSVASALQPKQTE